MKLLRIYLLALLAVLLPVRGVMAAAMPCGPLGGGSHSQTSVMGHGVGQHPHHESAAHQQGVQAHEHGSGSGPQVEHGHASQDKCNMCSASCSTPPLPSAAAILDEPSALTAASFPALAVPAPTFQSDGQERPPRTI